MEGKKYRTIKKKLAMLKNAMNFQAPSVSRETQQRFATYLDLLRKWSPVINLVGPGTLAQAEQRHIRDSSQVYPLLPKDVRHVVDMGSGAGFPGLVLAMMGVPHVTLIESDQRKATFLREVARTTETHGVTVLNQRLESLSIIDLAAGPADVVTARALAPLTELLDYAHRFLAQKGICIFLKGKSALDEIATAKNHWHFHLESFPSTTDPQGTLLRISELARV